VRYVVGKISTRATSLVQTSSQSDAAVGSYELPKSWDSARDSFGTISGQFRDSNPGVSGVPGKSDIRAWVPPIVTEYTIGSMVVAYSRGPGRGVSCGPKCPWLVPTPKGVLECELTTWVVCFDADSSLIY
jgi:hypothetical protein